MQVEFARIEQAMLSMKTDVKLEFTTQLSAMRAEVAGHVSSVRTGLTGQIESVRSDLMKWSFVFWVGAVAAIAMLADALKP